MTDISRAYEVDFGYIVGNENGDGPFITGGPSSPLNTYNLPTRTVYFQTFTDSPAKMWVKTGPTISEWVLQEDLTFESAIEVPRSPMFLLHNGTLNNGQLIGYSNTLNLSPILPFRGQIKELSFVNAQDSIEADFRFYKNTEDPGNLFYTWEVRTAVSEKTDYVVAGPSTFTSPTFERGDTLIIRMDDQGTNPNDAALGIFWKTLEGTP